MMKKETEGCLSVDWGEKEVVFAEEGQIRLQLKRSLVICCIGDSLTEGDYGVKGKTGIGNVHPENYPYFLAKELSDRTRVCETRNFGKCGYRASNSLQYFKEGNMNLKGADLVLVMLGTNGGHSTGEDTADNQAYRELLREIRKEAPEAKLILMTPPHATEDPRWSNCGYAPQVKAADAFVRGVAEEMQLPVIDVHHCESFCAQNEDLYQAHDGLHFVEAGYRQLAAFIAGELKERFI